MTRTRTVLAGKATARPTPGCRKIARKPAIAVVVEVEVEVEVEAEAEVGVARLINSRSLLVPFICFSFLYRRPDKLSGSVER